MILTCITVIGARRNESSWNNNNEFSQLFAKISPPNRAPATKNHDFSIIYTPHKKKPTAATKCRHKNVVTQKLVFLDALRRKRAHLFLNWQPLLSVRRNSNNKTTTSLTEKPLCSRTCTVNLRSLLSRYGESLIQTALKKHMVVSLHFFGFLIEKKPATPPPLPAPMWVSLSYKHKVYPRWCELHTVKVYT